MADAVAGWRWAEKDELLPVGECPAHVETGGESNSPQTLYSSAVFLKSFPAVGFGAAELDGRERAGKAIKARGLPSSWWAAGPWAEVQAGHVPG